MTSPWKEAGRPPLPPALLALAAAALGLGLTLPVVTLRTGFSHDTYSVLGGIADLMRSHEVLLALIVLSFSVLFPIVKLALLARTLFAAMDPERRLRLVRSLELLGRWSMLDVFVVAILIGSVQLGILSDASAEPGVYVFALAVLLSMVATHALRRLWPAPQELPRPAASPLERWSSLIALTLFGIGLFVPLLEVQKLAFWDNEYSVISASRRMLDEGEGGLALAVLMFVVALPLARFVAIVLLRWSHRPARYAASAALLDHLAMLDVFGLALLVVVAKIGSVATVETRRGFWILLLAAALSLRDSWSLRRARASERVRPAS